MLSRSCSACGKDGIGVTTTADGSIRSCVPGRDDKKWSTSVATTCTQGSPEKLAPRETGRAPIKTGDGRRRTRDNQGSPTCARGGSRRNTRRTRDQSCTRRRRRWRRFKVVLSESATGERGRKVVALVNVRRAYFNAPARRRVFVELPPEDYQPGGEHMCGLLQYSLYGTRDAVQNWEEELESTLSDLKLTRGSACPCVWRGRIKGEDTFCNGARRRHHNRWRTVGGGILHEDDFKNVRN